jgi:hypothetical protein
MLLFAFAKPLFVLFHLKITCGNLDPRYSLLPSVELLSITNISALIFVQALTTEQRHCSKKYFTLKFTMITDKFNAYLFVVRNTSFYCSYQNLANY